MRVVVPPEPTDRSPYEPVGDCAAGHDGNLVFEQCDSWLHQGATTVFCPLTGTSTLVVSQVGYPLLALFEGVLDRYHDRY